MALEIPSEQPRFPLEDLTESNARFLEIMLLHDQTIAQSHDAAESISYLYTAGHASLSTLALRHLSEDEQAKSVSFGMTTYEAMSSLVRYTIDNDVHNGPLVRNKIATLFVALDEDIEATLSTARDRFSKQMPRASRVVGESAVRFCGERFAEYAVAGAGLIRQAEIGV